MAVYYRGGEAAKQFVDTFKGLSYTHSAWQAWSDMIFAFAAAISNAVDKRHFEAREKHYMEVINRYQPDEQKLFVKLFDMYVDAVDANPWQDFLGDLFMNLELGSHWHGQFFTPYNICKTMAALEISDTLTAEFDKKGWVTIHDPACGAGATLIAAADVMKNERDVNYQQRALFTGQDIDETTALMCYCQLSVLGCAGYVHIGNTLTEPMTGHALFADESINTWYTPMFFSGRWEALRTMELYKNLL